MEDQGEASIRDLTSGLRLPLMAEIKQSVYQISTKLLNVLFQNSVCVYQSSLFADK